MENDYDILGTLAWVNNQRAGISSKQERLRDLHQTKLAREKLKAKGSGVGSVLSLVGTVAAPFTGGLSLFATGASLGVFVGNLGDNFFVRMSEITCDISRERDGLAEIVAAIETKKNKLNQTINFLNNRELRITDCSVLSASDIVQQFGKGALAAVKAFINIQSALAGVAKTTFIIVRVVIVKSTTVFTITTAITSAGFKLTTKLSGIIAISVKYTAEVMGKSTHALAESSAIVSKTASNLSTCEKVEQTTKTVHQIKTAETVGEFRKGVSVVQKASQISKFGVGLGALSLAYDIWNVSSLNEKIRLGHGDPEIDAECEAAELVLQKIQDLMRQISDAVANIIPDDRLQEMFQGSDEYDENA